MEPSTIALLTAAAGCAGFVDAIAGGGGLIAMPALLLAGLSPVEAVATNKLQGTFGVASAALTYWRRGTLEIARVWQHALAAAIGSVCGSLAVGAIDAKLLAALMPVVLAVVALYFAIPRKAHSSTVAARLSNPAFAALVALPVGAYDGFFGPGTGAFFMLGFVAVMGLDELTATARTKALNLASNLAALAIFLMAGHVSFEAGLPMAVAQVVGSHLGARQAVSRGAALIRPLLVVTTSVIAVKLVADALR